MTIILSKECCDCEDIDDNDLGPCDECDAACTLSVSLSSRTEYCNASPPGIDFVYTLTPTLNGLTVDHYEINVYDNTGFLVYGPWNIGGGNVTLQFLAESAPTNGWYIVHTLFTVQGTTCDSAQLPIDLYGGLIWLTSSSTHGATFDAPDRLTYALAPCALSSIDGTYKGTVKPCVSGTTTIHKVELILGDAAGAPFVAKTVLHPNGLSIASAGTLISIPYTSTPIAYNVSSDVVPYQIKLYRLVGQVYEEVAHGPSANVWWQGNYGQWRNLYLAVTGANPSSVNTIWSGVLITAPITGARALQNFPWGPVSGTGNTASNSSNLIKLSCHTPISLNVSWDFHVVPDELLIETCVAYGAIANGVPGTGWTTLFTTGNVNGVGSTTITTPMGHSWMKIKVNASQSSSIWTAQVG